MNRKLDTDWKRLKELPDEDIDFSDAPELDNRFFEDAEMKPGVRKPDANRQNTE